MFTKLFRGVIFLCGAVVLCATQKLHADTSKPVIHAELTPSQLQFNAAATLTVTMDCPTTTDEQTVEVTPPPGFTVSPKSYQLGTTAGTKTRQFEVQTPRAYIAPANWRFFILFSARNAELASLSVPFPYRSGIPLYQYFLLGVFGIGVGYLARLVVDSLNALPKPVLPVPAAVAGPAGALPAPDLGWFTAFIRNHYYFMDFVVTLVLGFLALTVLIKDNHPPDSGMYWYSALSLGFGIGLLTNSDLVTRLRTK